MPYLTVRMAARIQGFDDSWRLFGSKTHAYRQVGNAFPPPVAMHLGTAIAAALKSKRSKLVAASDLFKVAGSSCI